MSVLVPAAATVAADDLLALLAPLRARIYAGDDTHGFVEREQVIDRLAAEVEQMPLESRHATILETILAEVSTPIEPEDALLGRAVEGRLPDGLPYRVHLPGFNSAGHLTPDYPALLTKGLDQIAAEARATAARLGTDQARWFAASATRCCRAVVGFARRYADAADRAADTSAPARAARLRQVAEALRVSPAGPATTFVGALQAIWLVHFVMSCYVGSRDFAFGRLDQTLWPLYQQDLADGSLTRETALAWLAHFVIKTKEITGTATDNHRPKPIPSQASNQYVIVGGLTPAGQDAGNDLSALVLEAVALAQVPQPCVNVRLSPVTSPKLKRAVAQALPTCAPQVQFWNDARIIPALGAFGWSPAEAHDYALTACNRTNLAGVFDFTPSDAFHNCAEWLMAALGEQPNALADLNAIVAAFGRVAGERLAAVVTERARWMQGDPRDFHFESLLLQNCVARGRDLNCGGLRERAQYHFFGGIATAANALAAIEQLVYTEHRFSLPEYLAIVADDFAGHEALRLEVVERLPKFGNDVESVDRLAVALCDLALDALAAAPNPDGYQLLPSIYSLHCHLGWGRSMPATPDGRRAGEPISENQSPTHGTDRAGVTALLRSVARLPFHRTPAGGLNVKLAGPVDPQVVLCLTESYFALGGLHIGYTFVDRETLAAAQVRPDEYRTLCVRVTGFSEYFTALSPEAQADVIARTEH